VAQLPRLCFQDTTYSGWRFSLMRTAFPRLYAIVVPSRIGSGSLPEVCEFARELVAGGATLIQLREKDASAKEILRLARELRRTLPIAAKLIVNDRADLAVAAQADGIHVGQDDIPPDAARRIIGTNRLLGVSTHSPEQVEIADGTSGDYVAIGPVFGTTSKENPDPVIGLEGVRLARTRTHKSLVAIGGVTLQNCRSVVEAGADSVAVISELLGDPCKTTADFLRQMR
jgi:thiamine-phosphate pyrophosphorylase